VLLNGIPWNGLGADWKVPFHFENLMVVTFLMEWYHGLSMEACHVTVQVALKPIKFLKV
jgi:hypothetical protein